jgi:hypothetical protein
MENSVEIFNGRDFEGFKLISLELFEAPLFGSLRYDFIEKDNSKQDVYFTVLIGQNGTLKSRLFSKLIHLFEVLTEIRDDAAVTVIQEKFYLKYSSYNQIYEFTNNPVLYDSDRKTKLYGYGLKIDGVAQDNVGDFLIPAAIIANAIMITDRFPFPNPVNFPIYQYLGSRYRPQLAGTKTYIGRVVEFVSNNIDSTSFITGVRKIAKEFLQEGNEPCITYYTQNTARFFKHNITESQFYSYFEDLDKKYKENPSGAPFKLNHYKSKIKSNETIASRVVEYCNDLKNSNRLRSFKGSRSKAITFNLLNEEDIDSLRTEFELLNHMRQLGILYQAEIEFLTNTDPDNKLSLDGYSIVDSSSGEHNLFGSLIGLLASIVPNSLVFIDEPEVSLHPNWQMRYLSFLRELLADKKFASCHVFVATHSHFLISDLKGESSSVVSLKRGSKNKLSAQILRDTNTYGWSAEQVLLDVFNVPTTRNFYIAERVGKMLKKAALGEKADLTEYKDELLNYRKGLPPEDPLHYTITKIAEKYKWLD